MSGGRRSLSQIIEQVGKEEIGYVRDGPIHYVVLNNKRDFVFNLDRINRFLAILDQIESESASEGPGVLVTVGTGKKMFSTGFDLPYWLKSYENHTSSIVRFQELMARLLELSIPSMCVFNGSAFAGGYILGVCHD